LEHKDLEKKRGFIGHVAMTFPALVLFMNGFHLIIDSWRDYRPTSGWKMNEKVWSSYVEVRIADGDLSEEEARAMLESLSDGAAPKNIQALLRFKAELQAMKVYFGPPTLPRLLIGSFKSSTLCMASGMPWALLLVVLFNPPQACHIGPVFGLGKNAMRALTSESFETWLRHRRMRVRVDV
jgi:hypothetical protein